MARAGQSVENPATGERIVFLRTAADTGGALLEMEDHWTRPGHRTAPHVHPEMEERWEVVEGTAAFRIGDEDRTAGPGEVVVAPPGVTHLAWNPTGEPVRLRIEMRPALRWEDFVERLFGLAAEGHMDERGRLDRQAAAELARDFPREIAAPTPLP